MLQISENGSIERWRSCSLDAPRKALLHGDSKSICTSNGKWKDQSQLQDKRGEIAKTQNLQTKTDSSPLWSLQQQSAEPPVRCGRKSDGITLAGFGSLLTKILFSFRSTEVYGILIVMKIPAERSRSWGLRSNPWLLIGEVREVFYTSTLILGACTSEHLGDSIVLTLMGKLNMILVLIW